MSVVELSDDGEMLCVVQEQQRRKYRTHADPTSTCVLLRSKDGEVRIGFISVSSYSGTESQNIRLHGMDLEDVMGRDIVVVEDIIDSGKTMEYICGKLSELSPKSVKICTLLNKPLNRKNTLEIDYVGFEIEDHFVVGYGLDIDQKYRNLPYIGYVDTPN